MVATSGISEDLDKGKWSKPSTLQRFHVESSFASPRELIKGGVVGVGGKDRARGQPERKGSGKKGVWMEMLLLQPSLEPEPCTGKVAPRWLCSTWSPLLSSGRSWCLFLRLRNPAQCLLHLAQ